MTTNPFRRVDLALAGLQNNVCKRALRESLFSANPLDILYENLKISPVAMKQAQETLFHNSERGIGAVALGEEGYPAILNHIPDPPPILYYRGNVSQVNVTPCVSIVGSRKADTKACRLAAEFASHLSSMGVCVVSGLALGIDGAAHKGAIKASSLLPTIAVMGNGLSRVYPSSHRKLAQQILESGGVLLSQFEADERPYPSNFLNRNRIIAGLSHATIVIQAGQRSGSLVTARNAAEEGREVFVVPGDILDARYKGSHKLIRDGATLVASIEDVLEDLPEELKIRMLGVKREAKAHLTPEQIRIVNLVSESGQVDLYEIQDRLPELENLELELLQLELAGEIQQLPGNQYQVL